MSASVCLKVFPRIYKNCGVGRQLPAALPGGSTLALQSLLESGSANVWEQELSPPSHPVLCFIYFPFLPLASSHLLPSNFSGDAWLGPRHRAGWPGSPTGGSARACSCPLGLSAGTEPLHSSGKGAQRH